MKLCTKCQQTLSLDCFAPRRARPGRHYSECRECTRQRSNKWAADNRERRTATGREWCKNNREKSSAFSRAYNERHPERAKAIQLASAERRKAAGYFDRWYQENLDVKRAKNREWSKKNPAAHLALCARRRAAVSNRYPPWADDDKIKAFYEEARRLSAETGIPHDVDHIIPLRGRMISGLHVEGNLQVITAEANRKKQARVDLALL